MFELRCTVRNCLSPLTKFGGQLTCDAGHSFDRAKQGYWNLTQPQDCKSNNPGDTDEAVMARHRWLTGGIVDGMIEVLRPWIVESQDGGTSTPRTLDLGCGEGSLAPKLFADEAEGYCGIDLSKRAMRMASRNWPEATWVLANADRILPANDASVDRVVSLFGRRPVAEISRVLVSGGTCIVAVPGEDDLIELREQVQQEGHRRNRWESIVDEFKSVGLSLVKHQRWQEQVELDADAIADAMAMTYRAVRFSQHARLKSLRSEMVTVSADLLLLKKS